MNRLFRRIPFAFKLLLIGLLPLAFIIFLTVQLYEEKDKNINVLQGQIERINQVGNISNLIHELQTEQKLSFDLAIKKTELEALLKQRIGTDSALKKIKEIDDPLLNGFEEYTSLNQLLNTRIQLDSGHLRPDRVTHFYSNTTFRLNTLSSISFGTRTVLRPFLNDIQAQKLLTEMNTYLGIIRSNIYNVLVTRQYMLETLAGTLGAYDVYKSYESEFLIKASPSAIDSFKKIRNHSDFKPTIEYIHKLFASFKFDSSYNAEQWWTVSEKGLDELTHLRNRIWNTVNINVNTVYENEIKKRNRTLIILIVIIVLVVGLIVFTIGVLTKMLMELKRAAEKISQGKTNLNINIHSRDAIGSLAKSISKIDENNKQLTDAADAIGKGNFNTQIFPRSTEDILGNALLKMKDDLQLSTKELEKSKEQFRELADFVPQMVWTARPDGYLDYYNKQWFEFTGFSENYGDNSWIPILHPDDVQHCYNAWYNSVRTGEPYQIEYRFKDHLHPGQYRWFLGRAIPIKDESGKIIKWFGTCTDIHERKMMSEELEQQVKERTEDLERSNADLQQFAHVASHDLQEPLRKIKTFSHQLQIENDHVLPQKSKIYLDKIQHAANRMSKMIDGVLNYSMAGTTGQPFEKIDLNDLITGITGDLELVMVQKGAVINYNNLPSVKGIPVLIYQLFYNLINNSLKFSKDDIAPVIDIKAEKVKGIEEKNIAGIHPVKEYFKIQVKDNGIGFDTSYTEKMFNIFTRLNSHSQYEGTGLGLALARKIITRHKGFIYAESEENNGSLFTILLPG